MKRLSAFLTLTLIFCCAAANAQKLQERSLDGAPQHQTQSAQPGETKPATPEGEVQSAQTAPEAQAESPADPTGEDTILTPKPVQKDPKDMTPEERKTYNRREVQREVEGFFEGGSAGLAEVLSRPFDKYGKPTGFIKGNEAGGALVIGLRYGAGLLHLKGQKPVKVYWQSPSIGFDLGANACKVFTLVYNVDNPDEIFQRFPGVDGSAYIIGGFGLNYQQSGKYILAPIRFGVGLRLGAAVGYQHYTRKASIIPF